MNPTLAIEDALAAVRALASRRRKLSNRQREAFYQDLASALATGLPIVTTLEAMRASIVRDPKDPPDRVRRRTPISDMLEECAQGERSGDGFSSCLPNWVPKEEATLIAAGAAASLLPSTLSQAVRIIEAKRLSRETLLKAVSYPAVLILLLFVLLAGVAYLLVPQLSLVLPVERWTGAALLLYGTANFVTVTFVPVVVVLLAVASLYSLTLDRWCGRGVVGRLRVVADRHAPFAYYRLIVGAQFMIGLAALKAARMADREALEMLKADVSPWLAERLNAVTHYVRRGDKLGDAMVNAGHEFPDRDLIWRIRIHADRGSLDESLPLIAATWLADSNARIRRQANWLNRGLTVFVAAVLGFIVLGYLDLNAQIAADWEKLY